MALTPRQEIILRAIVSDYVATGQPVGSATVLRHSDLGVSTATIRNDMAALEEAGYIAHPHTSAGRVPSDLGYRYYIETLMQELDLSVPEKMTIRHQFHQVELDIDEWSHLAASVLARSVRNAALVTRPLSSAVRLKQAHFVGVHERLILLVLVFQEAGVKQQYITVEDPVGPADLLRLGNRLTAEAAGCTAREIQAMVLADESDHDAWAIEHVIRLMQSVDDRGHDDLHLEGLRYVLQQREFGDQDKVLRVVETLEDRTAFAPLLDELLTSGGLRVLIGRENQQEPLQHLSLIVARYGSPDDLVGAVGVVGPTRMAYDRVVPTVRYLVTVLDDLVKEIHG